MPSGTRINKYLADQKIASRREADALISAGKVLINGVPAILGQHVTDSDTVSLTGATSHKTYLAYYKGRGIITHSPAAGEIDIATRLKQDYSLTHVHPIGRLDKDSEGLMLLSDDGRLTGPLLDSEANHEKEYEVTVDKPLSGMAAKIMSHGVDIEGYRTKSAVVVPRPQTPTTFTITLTEGKKHQIRRMCAALGYQVQRLKRVRIMHIRLDSLKPNQFRKLTKEEIKALLHETNITS